MGLRCVVSAIDVCRCKSPHRDLKTYQDTIVSFGLPALSERFEFLRQLGNVFLVRPEILKSYITENYLGRIEPALLRPYLAQRSDWAQFERAFDFGTADDASASVSPDPMSPLPEATMPRGAGGVNSLRDRLNAVSVSNRLSTMMRDLENVRIGGGRGFSDVGNRLSLAAPMGLHFSAFPTSSFPAAGGAMANGNGNGHGPGHGSAL